jgi:hypothetical protein
MRPPVRLGQLLPPARARGALRSALLDSLPNCFGVDVAGLMYLRSEMPADGIGAAAPKQDFGTSRWAARGPSQDPQMKNITLAKLSEGGPQADRHVSSWHVSDLLARHNYFRFLMRCRRDVLVASLSAHDPSRTSASGSRGRTGSAIIKSEHNSPGTPGAFQSNSGLSRGLGGHSCDRLIMRQTDCRGGRPCST